MEGLSDESGDLAPPADFWKPHLRRKISPQTLSASKLMDEKANEGVSVVSCTSETSVIKVTKRKKVLLMEQIASLESESDAIEKESKKKKRTETTKSSIQLGRNERLASVSDQCHCVETWDSESSGSEKKLKKNRPDLSQDEVECNTGVKRHTRKSPSKVCKWKMAEKESITSSSSQVKQNIYTSDKLKFSRSRLGAFRRKGRFKFAALIFSNEGSKKTERNKEVSHGKKDVKSKKMQTVKISPMTDESRSCQKYEPKLTLNQNDVNQGRSHEFKRSPVVPPSTQGTVFKMNQNTDDAKTEFDEISPRKTEISKTHQLMSEIFFEDVQRKIKPAPKKRTMLHASATDEKSSGDSEITLLDDDSLWSSPKKSSV